MPHGSFIWTDLSTYHPKSSINFYQSVFEWNIEDEEGYHLASLGSSAISGIYETPPFFQKIKMPHFWMSYFQVDSVMETVALAGKLGAKVEIPSAEFFGGTIALIRDPQGAGFTVFEGKNLVFGSTDSVGSVLRTELHVSNLQNVVPFYSQLFEWNLTPLDDHHYRVETESNERVIELLQIDNERKGKYEYWTISFKTDDLVSTSKRIKDAGGSLISDEGHKKLFTDNSGEAFFYLRN